MTADIIYFNKDCKPENKVMATCSFCKKHFENFKGLQASTSTEKKSICKDCAKKCADLIKEANKPFQVKFND